MGTRYLLKGTCFFFVSLLAGSVFAHELDNDSHGTTIIRRSKADPTDISIAHSKKHLQPGETLAPQSFRKVAKNGDRNPTPFDSTNELDRTSSTSSWIFENPWATAGGPPYGSSYSYGGGYADNYGVDGEGYGNQFYNPWYQPYNGGWSSWAPYFQYQDPNYGYSYWGW